MDIIREARIASMRYLVGQLDEYIELEEYKPKRLFRISGFDEECCFECAEEMANRVAAECMLDPQSYPHEAWERAEPVECDGCGKVLAYSLSWDGAAMEVHDFIDTGRTFHKSILPDEAYKVRQVLIAFHDVARFGPDDAGLSADDYRKAITLGQMAITAIPKQSEQLDLFNGAQHGQEADIHQGERISSAPNQPY